MKTTIASLIIALAALVTASPLLPNTVTDIEMPSIYPDADADADDKPPRPKPLKHPDRKWPKHGRGRHGLVVQPDTKEQDDDDKADKIPLETPAPTLAPTPIVARRQGGGGGKDEDEDESEEPGPNDLICLIPEGCRVSLAPHLTVTIPPGEDFPTGFLRPPPLLTRTATRAVGGGGLEHEQDKDKDKGPPIITRLPPGPLDDAGEGGEEEDDVWSVYFTDYPTTSTAEPVPPLHSSICLIEECLGDWMFSTVVEKREGADATATATLGF